MPTRTLELIVQEGCNLRCSYCFEGHKKPRAMQFGTALAAIETHMCARDGYDTLMIDFMGGEPMLAFGTIRMVVEYVQSRDWPKAYHFSMSTNGTLFTAEIQRWFIERKRIFTPMLSFDGTRFAQNTNRSGSHDRVMRNVDFFRAHWPHQPVKMTVNPAALPHLADGILSILALGLKVDCNLVQEPVWGDGPIRSQHRRALEFQLARLVDFYTTYAEVEPTNLVNLPITMILQRRDPGTPWCGAGEGLHAVGSDGVTYPCHRFMPFSAGESMPLEVYRLCAVDRSLQSPCAHCQMINACPTCQARNWEFGGSLHTRTTFACELHKLQMIATAAIHSNRIWKLLDLKAIEEIETDVLEEAAVVLEAARRTFEALTDIPEGELRPYVVGERSGGHGRENRVRWWQDPPRIFENVSGAKLTPSPDAAREA